jgi:hypothetical protein
MNDNYVDEYTTEADATAAAPNGYVWTLLFGIPVLLLV